jgi:transposase InsO family protein
MQWKLHVRFGGRAGETHRSKDGRALRSDPYTYCSTWSGVVYVAFITDVFSRRIVGWKASRSMSAALVVDALNMAAWVRRGVELAGVICHSDAGGQYVSIAYTDRLDDIGASPSIGTVGDSFDNSAPSRFASLRFAPLSFAPLRSAPLSASLPTDRFHSSTPLRRRSTSSSSAMFK